MCFLFRIDEVRLKSYRFANFCNDSHSSCCFTQPKCIPYTYEALTKDLLCAQHSALWFGNSLSRRHGGMCVLCVVGNHNIMMMMRNFTVRSTCVIGLVVVGAYCRPALNPDHDATKAGVLEKLKGSRGRHLHETLTSVLQKQREGNDAGQKFAARLEQLLDTAKAQYEESSGHSTSGGEYEEYETTKGVESATEAETVDEKIGKALGSALSRFEKGTGERFGADTHGQVRDALSGLETGIRKRVDSVQPGGDSRVLLEGGRLSSGIERGDGTPLQFGGLAAGLRESGLKPSIEGLKGNHTLDLGAGFDGDRPSIEGLPFEGLKGNHTLNLGGLDRDHDGGMGGWCSGPPSSTTSTAVTLTTAATTTVTTAATTTAEPLQTPPGGRRLLPEGIGAGLLNGGGNNHSDDEGDVSTIYADEPHTYDQVQYVADLLNKTDGWVLVQWPESKSGVKLPLRLLKKERNAMPVEDIVLLYILRNGGVSEHAMTYFHNRTADEFMRNPSDTFVAKYEEFVHLLEMLWDFFVDFFQLPANTTTSTATMTWLPPSTVEHSTAHEATTYAVTPTAATWSTADGDATVTWTTTTTVSTSTTSATLPTPP
eukprot:Lankesteria_metandrocarpae@DN5488_c0_g1_i15.p1